MHCVHNVSSYTCIHVTHPRSNTLTSTVPPRPGIPYSAPGVLLPAMDQWLSFPIHANTHSTVRASPDGVLAQVHLTSPAFSSATTAKTLVEGCRGQWLGVDTEAQSWPAETEICGQACDCITDTTLCFASLCTRNSGLIGTFAQDL